MTPCIQEGAESQPLLRRPGTSALEEADLARYSADGTLPTLGEGVAFSSAGSLLHTGSRRQLEQGDLRPLPPDLQPSVCGRLLWREWEAERTERPGEPGSPPSLLRALVAAYGRPFFALGSLKLASDALNFAGPLLLNALLRHLGSSASDASGARREPQPGGAPRLPHEPWWADVASPAFGYACAALLAATLVLKAVLNTQFNYRQGLVSARLRSAVTMAVYRKTLAISSATVAQMGTGRVATLMSVDADRVVNLCLSFWELISLPLQILVALALLYTQVRYAFLAGVAVVLLLIPANRWLALRIQAASVRMMGAKDRRVRAMMDVLRGIRQIKVYAWEPFFVKQVGMERSDELAALGVRKYLDALCVYFWAATSLLFSLATFGVAVLMGQQLTAPLVFTSLALFNVLIAPLNAFPWVINGVVEAVVSLRRVAEFLGCPEVPASFGGAEAPPSEPLECRASPTICIHAGAFSWGGPAPTSKQLASAGRVADGGTGGVRPATAAAGAGGAGGGDGGATGGVVLSGVEWEVPRGALVAVAGEVGAGKSSLLAALLGELHCTRGKVEVRGSVAYVPQEPWILRGTVRDNILLGAPMRRRRYEDVLGACALDHDLRALPAGDLSQAGDAGARLSGGQRVRVALARALYQDRDVYLLDDVLAGVDAHVAAWLTRHALLGPLLAGKTVVVATHAPALLAAATAVVRVGRGGQVKVVPQAPTMELGLPQAPTLAGFTDGSGAPCSSSSSSSSSDSAGLATEAAAGSAAGREGQGSLLGIGRKADGGAPLGVGAEPGSDEAERWGPGPEDEAWTSPEVEGVPQEEGEAAEERASGHVRAAVYLAYMRATGWGWVALILVSLALMQGTRNGNDLWLSYWVSHAPTSPGPKQHTQTRPALIMLPGPPLPVPPWLTHQAQPHPQLQQQPAWDLGRPTPSLRWLSKVCAGSLKRPEPNFPGPGSEGSFATEPGGSQLMLWAGWTSLDPEVRFYLRVLLGIAAANSVFTLVRAFSFAKGGLVAAERTHARLLAAVLCLPASFFDATPSGRTLNRFSSDTATVDDSLPFILNILLANLASLAGVAAVLVLTQPALLALLLPLGVVYRALQRYYRATSRELKRLDALALSPVYTAFTEALSGGPTIRAFGVQQQFLEVTEAALAAQQRVNLASLGASNWLGLRLQLMAAALAAALAGAAVMQHQGLFPGTSSALAAGLVGLSLSYVFPITGLLNGLLTSSAETEQEMVAMERLMQYITLPPQPITVPPTPAHDRTAETGGRAAPMGSSRHAAGDVERALTQPLLSKGPMSEEDRKHLSGATSGAAAPPGPGWVQQGHVEYKDVWLRYRPQGPDVLRGLSLDVPAGAKLGICGRTGAGKSSLIFCLFRLAEVTGGSITVDGWDIARIPLHQLRSAIGMVPQTPFLFHGSVRENLDPSGTCPDSELVAALQHVQLWRMLCRLEASGESIGSSDAAVPAAQPGQSSTTVSDPAPHLSVDVCPEPAPVGSLPSVDSVLSRVLGSGALGLSLGQQQLLCLARVLLKRPRLLCLDECTASVDPGTAQTMNKVIRGRFPGATVLEVAHRLGSVLGCDSVAVVEAGRVVELGSPGGLLGTPGSAFRRMVEEQQSAAAGTAC